MCTCVCLCVCGHMEKLQDNGALVMLGSTKRPRRAQTRGEGEGGGWEVGWGCCGSVCEDEGETARVS